jgi:hypothetical protein
MGLEELVCEGSDWIKLAEDGVNYLYLLVPQQAWIVQIRCFTD